MTPKDVIRYSIGLSDMVLEAYLADLSDDDLFLRPVAGMNHLAWQLGHLISSENSMLARVGVDMPALPDGFAESHTPETATSDDRSRFCTRQQYLEQLARQRTATMAALEKMSDADLDKPTPEDMQQYAKRAGDVFAMIGLHVFMHSGQWVAVRRKLGKPIAI